MTAARKFDPISSHLAAEEVERKGITRAQQIDALVLLKAYQAENQKNATRSELAYYRAVHKWTKYQFDPDAHAALVKGEIQIQKAALGRRLPELAQQGLVTATEIRKCQVANRMTQAWRLTEAGMREATKYAKEHRHD